jgi:hypothetical protein
MNNAAAETRLEVPTTILAQLGGRRFMMMTGAVVSGDEATLYVRFKGSTVANKVHVTLNGRDLYDVEFFKVRGVNARSVKSLSDVYAEDLQRIFTDVTGLYTSL